MSPDAPPLEAATLPLNIVLFTASYAPRVGGLETAVARLAREFRQAGHRVTVITNRYPRSLPASDTIDGVPVRRILFPALIVPRSEWGQTSMLKYLLLLPLVPWTLLRLWWLLYTLRPNVVNVHYLSTPALYVAILRALGGLTARVVVSCHGSDLTTVPYPTGSPAASRWILDHADAVTTCSADLARYMALMSPRFGLGEIAVVYNGTDPDEFAGAAPYRHPRPYIFTAGRLVEKKGMHFLIEALALLRGRGIDCDLIIAGSGPEEDRLRALAGQLGLDGHVHFAGSADRARLAALYHGCAVFALAPVWEGFGIVSLEAMSCGRAVVATRTGGIPEVVVDGETGLLARPSDPADLADKLEDLLSDPERAAAMGRAGRERVLACFTWPVVAARYFSSYLSPVPVRRYAASGCLVGTGRQDASGSEDGPEPAAVAVDGHRRGDPAAWLADVLARERDAREALRLVAAHIGTALGADYAGIALREPDGSLFYCGIWGTRSATWPVLRLPPGRGFVGLVARERRTLSVDHLGEDSSTSLRDFPSHLGEGGRTALGTPLWHGRTVLGAVTAGWRENVTVSAEQQRLIEDLAAPVAAFLAGHRRSVYPLARPSAGASAAVPVLMYHQVAPPRDGGVKPSLLVTPSAFAAQMRWLHRLGWRTMRLVDVIALLETGQALPRRRFVLTFDDAFADVAWYAAPALLSLGFTATIFVPTGLVGTCRAMDGGSDHPAKGVMDWATLRELHQAGFDIGAHSRSHAHLTRLDAAGLRAEIAGSRDDIADALGVIPSLFAYPFGEWNPAVAAAVHDAGFAAACATHFGRVTPGVHRFGLPRISVSQDLDLPHFAYRLAFAGRITRQYEQMGAAGEAHS